MSVENIGKIKSISDYSVEIILEIDIYDWASIVGKYVVLEDKNNKYVGEISKIDGNIANVVLHGEIVNGIFSSGVVNKPAFNSKIRLLENEEISLFTNNDSKNVTFNIGNMVLYNNAKVNVSLNDFFSNHFSIFGATGSGKSCSVSRIIQNIMSLNPAPYMSNIFLFDAYGEYVNAFSKLGNSNKNLNYKVYTTNIYDNVDEHTTLLNIPLWLLDVDDYALLLGVSNQQQIPIIEHALKLVTVFTKKDNLSIKHKNHIIASALLDVLTSGKNSSHVRDQVIAILSSFNTEELNLDTKIVQPGYIRTLRQCLIIDKSGKLNEIQLVIEFLEKYIDNSLELVLPDGSFLYTLETLREAFEFSCVAEGVLKSDKVYDYTNILKVRLDNLINSEYSKYFRSDVYITKDEYIKQLLLLKNGKKAQIIDFNINYVDDRLAKNIVKIFSKLLFNYSASLKKRASFPFHIILEEAHRYVQKDLDVSILGYNIFDRIAKEGRKYGVILGLISQRPSELSETVLSQCSNFLIFKMLHPLDIEYVKKMTPSITSEVCEKLKNLQPGMCISFGISFKIPMVLSFDLPDPLPNSNNCNIDNTWFIN